MHNLVSQRPCPRCGWSHHESETSCHWCNYNMAAGTTAADRRHAKQPNFYLVRDTPHDLPIVTRTILRSADVNLGIAPALAGDPATSRAMPLHDALAGINALTEAGILCRWEIRNLWSACRVLGDPSLPMYAIIDTLFSDIQYSKQRCLIEWSRYLAKVHPARYERLSKHAPDWLITTTSWVDIKIEAAQLLAKDTK